MEWQPGSWRNKPALQLPEYPDPQALDRTLQRISDLPPVVFPGEVERLKRQIAEAGEGKRFILQGGDCVERFEDCGERRITNKIKILLQMSVILTYAARKPVLKIGRIAGQYFKPRTSEYEGEGEHRIPTYRGDGINGNVASDRTPDPGRLEQSYFSSAATLNYIRAMISGGFADLHNPHNWDLYPMEQSANWQEYRNIVEHIMDAVTFMESFGGINENVGNIDFYTSHEGLHLGYEEAMTRRGSGESSYFNLGAHMVWIGERTRGIDGAHVEYFRGIENPVGIKIGSSATPSDVIQLLKRLNPGNQPGKIVLITRIGADEVRKVLPDLVDGVLESGQPATWCCDPMHGNTVTAANGLKTRQFHDVLEEVAASFEVHNSCGSRLAGVHFELTGEDVTECLGGGANLAESDLDRNYESFCDPRLNYSQSMEMSFLISNYLKPPVS